MMVSLFTDIRKQWRIAWLKICKVTGSRRSYTLRYSVPDVRIVLIMLLLLSIVVTHKKSDISAQSESYNTHVSSIRKESEYSDTPKVMIRDVSHRRKQWRIVWCNYETKSIKNCRLLWDETMENMYCSGVIYI